MIKIKGERMTFIQVAETELNKNIIPLAVVR